MEQNEEEYNESKEKELFANKLVSIATKQVTACLDFKRPRMVDIQKNEDLYYNKVKKVLKGRWNIPLPIMSGFIDTLMAKTDDKVSIKYGYKDLADLRRSIKVSAAWDYESSPQVDNWDKKDRACKKQASLSGLGIYKFWSESDPEYKSNLVVPDIYDFIFEPNGGSELENHLFCGEKNIFKTKKQLEDGAKSGRYNVMQVKKLFMSQSSNNLKDVEDKFNEKSNRFKSLGLDPITNNYVGQQIYSLNEHYMVYNGERYYILFDPKSGIWVKCEKLKDVFASNLWPYVTWQTHEDNFNFLSKAPADDIRPVAEAMKELFNQMMDNIEKRNFNQRIINPDMFSDLSEFNWRPNGLIKLKPGEARSINDGIYEFKVDDNSSVVVNIFSYLENYLGQKTGITQSAQGVSDSDKKVGIYFGEMQQVADRIGLQNKSYTEAQSQLGLRYYWGIKEHMSEGMMVRIIGSKGAEWEEITKEDLNWSDDPDIFVSSGNLQSQTDALTSEKKIMAIDAIIANPLLSQKLNPDWVIEKRLMVAGWEEADIKRATNLETFGNDMSISEAEQMIQDVLANKEVKINRGATVAFCQRLLDFSIDDDIDLDKSKKLQDLAVKHLPIAQENEKRNIRQIMMNKAINGMQEAPAYPNTPQMTPSATPMPNPSETAVNRPTMPQEMGVGA